MTTTDSTPTSAEMLDAAGYERRANKYPGRCACGRWRDAGAARIARLRGGQNWLLICCRKDCTAAVLRRSSGPSLGEAPHDGAEAVDQ